MAASDLRSSKPADVPASSTTVALQSASSLPASSSSASASSLASAAHLLPALVNLEDYHQHARRYLPKQVYDYFSSGAHDERTLHENVHAYRRLLLRPRFLIDVSRMDTSVSVLGERLRSPLCVAPTAMQRMAHPDGELATARACVKRGMLMTLSSLSTTSLEDVAIAAQAAHHQSISTPAPPTHSPSSSSSLFSPPSPPSSVSHPPPHLWYQLYVYRDRSITHDLVRRAEAAGYKAIVLTVDTPQFGVRESDVRNRFTLPSHLQLANFTAGKGRSMSDRGAGTANSDGSGLAAYGSSMFDPSLSWKDLAWLRSITRLSLIVKGVLTAEDAELACEQGVDAIIVSNHGARQLDSVSATIDALPEVVEVVKRRGQGRVEVYMDGGVRRGSDVFKAVALGARAVFVGRPVLWGLSYAGELGVEQVLHILQTELELCMALCGCPDIGSIERNRVTTRQTLWRKAKL